jgi:hypothetical protein
LLVVTPAGFQKAVYPPSTVRTDPVTYDDSDDAKKSTASATSSGMATNRRISPASSGVACTGICGTPVRMGRRTLTAE